MDERANGYVLGFVGLFVLEDLCVSWAPLPFPSTTAFSQDQSYSKDHQGAGCGGILLSMFSVCVHMCAHGGQRTALGMVPPLLSIFFGGTVSRWPGTGCRARTADLQLSLAFPVGPGDLTRCFQD